jgi:flagellar biosynthesis/type III secretory pathway ATPase
VALEKIDCDKIIDEESRYILQQIALAFADGKGTTPAIDKIKHSLSRVWRAAQREKSIDHIKFLGDLITRWKENLQQ